MRGLGLIDLLVILAVVAVLVFAGTQQFHRYEHGGARPANPPAVPSP